MDGHWPGSHRRDTGKKTISPHPIESIGGGRIFACWDVFNFELGTRITLDGLVLLIYSQLKSRLFTIEIVTSLIVQSGFILMSPAFAWAEDEAMDYHEHEMKMKTAFSSADCSDMEVWDFAMAMCTPLPMAGMPMRMAMLRGNAFAVGITESGPRGRTDFASPNMFMADVGASIDDSQYLNLDYMGTLERWTFPYRGYPELLQIGELNSQGVPFVDAQHPHSSPVMGLTLSDTIRFNGGSKDSLKLFFAPRGESTDGPVAFVHRPTGMVNPDAPLGHHVGQDVGHISSTVIGASLLVGTTRIEASAFNGTEPEPDSVDLPLGDPNSFAARIIEEFSPNFTAMASVAYVKNPEPSDPEISSLYRYSASIYSHYQVWNGWKFDNALIFGLITNLDHASTLSSFGEEFLVHGDRPRIWGRIEVLQRTPGELEIPTVQNRNDGRWVEALTLGYTHAIAKWSDAELGLGSSVTVDVLPSEFSAAYGSRTPITGKLFLQFGGTRMCDL